MMKNLTSLASLLALLAPPANANDVMSGTSLDPTTELNTLFAKICKWDADTRLVAKPLNLTQDGQPDYHFIFDLPCRGQENAFSGIHGTAHQIWISTGDGYIRILDANARALTFESRDNREFIILKHAGSYCMTHDAAPCFLTLEFTQNALVWAEDVHQHPTMKARLAAAKKDQSND